MRICRNGVFSKGWGAIVLSQISGGLDWAKPTDPHEAIQRRTSTAVSERRRCVIISNSITIFCRKCYTKKPRNRSNPACGRNQNVRNHERATLLENVEGKERKMGTEIFQKRSRNSYFSVHMFLSDPYFYKCSSVQKRSLG